MDNHSTHSTLEAYTFCKANGIILLTIPPHSSHRLQPLDVTFYSPLKTAFNTECSRYLRNHAYEKISPYEIAELFNNAYMRVATLEKAVKGFQVTGIWPYNPNIFCEEDYAPTDVYNSNASYINQQDPNEIGHHSGLQQIPDPKNNTDSQDNMEISFEEVLPLPGPSKSQAQPIKRKRSTKQTSQIITASPNKDVLIEKANKKLNMKKKKNTMAVKRDIFSKDNDQKSIAEKNRVKLPRDCRTKTLKSSNLDQGSDDSDESNDDEDRDKNVVDQNICLVCGEFGKNNEIWLRCVYCGNWAHKACTDGEKKLFVCDYCT